MLKENSKYVNCCLCGASEYIPLYLDFRNNRYVKCNKCGLVYQNPRKTTRYVDNYWKPAIDPDGKVRDLTTEREDKIKNWYGGDIKYVNSLKPGKILDVGCGLGFFLSAINNQWGKYGVEISEFASDYARQHFPGINIFTGKLLQAKYNDNFFDVVYFYHVIEHVENPGELLKEIYRVTKTNGILVTGTPNIESFCAKRFKGNYRLLGTPHIILFPKSTLITLLEKNGFKPFKVRFPFFGTKYFTLGNLWRLINTKKVSPPFYGNIMTIYARKV